MRRPTGLWTRHFLSITSHKNKIPPSQLFRFEVMTLGRHVYFLFAFLRRFCYGRLFTRRVVLQHFVGMGSDLAFTGRRCWSCRQVLTFREIDRLIDQPP